MLVLQSANVNPIDHYKLDVGLLQPGDDADFILADNLMDFNILATYVEGRKVASEGRCLIDSVTESEPNAFHAVEISKNDIVVPGALELIKVMKAMDGQLITEEMVIEPKLNCGNVVADVDRDVLKLGVLNRYRKARPAMAFINNFNLKRGAIASAVAYDSHNILAVGTTDNKIVRAINLMINIRGGISLVDANDEHVLPLPVAGLMSTKDGFEIAKAYEKMDQLAKGLGTWVGATYMTLSFMALLVIPLVKLSDEGLFDGGKFKLTTLFIN